jgi:hypothetical protein
VLGKTAALPVLVGKVKSGEFGGLVISSTILASSVCFCGVSVESSSFRYDSTIASRCEMKLFKAAI